DRQRIPSRLNIDEDEQAAGVAGDGGLDVGGSVAQDHRGARNRRSSGIGDGTVHSAGSGLSVQKGGRAEREQGSEQNRTWILFHFNSLKPGLTSCKYLTEYHQDRAGVKRVARWVVSETFRHYRALYYNPSYSLRAATISIPHSPKRQRGDGFAKPSPR